MDILISEDLQNPALERLAQKYELVRDGALWRTPDRLTSAARDARALLVRNQTQVTPELLKSAPRLLAIGRVGVGLDNINVAAASELGIVVVAPLNANATSVAELTLGFILALARRIPQGDCSTKAGAWDRKACTGIELAGKTLAVCGLGRIGGMVAELARAFGMRVVGYDPFVKPGSPVLKQVLLCSSMDEALAAADFVTVHLPLTADTKGIFNQQKFAAMKRDAYFINTSRGGVVNESALIEALQSGHLAGAALDVREVEPPSSRGALESMDNVILTPHIAAFTTEAQTRTFEAVAQDVDRLLSGQPSVNFVNFATPKR